MKIKRAGLAFSGSLAVLGALAVPEALRARSVGIGESVIVTGPGGVADYWELAKDSSLVLSDGASSSYINLYQSTLRVTDSSVRSSRGTGIGASVRSVITMERSTVHDDVGAGFSLYGVLGSSPGGRSTMSMVDSTSTGLLFGAIVADQSLLQARRSLLSTTGADGVGLLLAAGQVNLTEGTSVLGHRAGALLGEEKSIEPGARSLIVEDNSTVKSTQGPAVLVSGFGAAGIRSSIVVRDGGTLVGGNGVAIDARDQANLHLSVEDSLLAGGLLIAPDSSARVRLRSGGHFNGAVVGPAHMNVERRGYWTIPEDSRVSNLTMSGGTVGFAPGQNARRSLRVSGHVDGTAGDLVVNVHMDGTGVSKSWADSVLVEGDVDVARPVDVLVNLTGVARPTDLNADGEQSPSEGFSLIQVAGTSHPEAFRLKGGYITFGAFQYQLKAFSGSDVDQAASLLETGPVQWDYRLAQRTVCESQCSAGDSDKDKGGERPAVAPQIASYISAPGAVFAYADSISTGLHERLGEIRDHAFEGSVGGELFARYSANDQNYSSDRAFKDYGYDFDEHVEAWQFGGSIVGLDGDNGSLRAGWAIDHGRSSVVPRAVDGDSVTRLQANGTSAWVTWRSGNGFWMDWVVSRQRMRGRTDTAQLGSVGRVRATATGISLGAGMPFEVAGGWRVEPHVLVASQDVAIDKISEAGGLDVKFGGRQYVTTTAGVSVVREVGTFAPFVRLDVRSTPGDGKVVAGTAATPRSTRFATGRAGDEYLLSGGLTAQLTDRLQVFGESSYRHYLGGGGFQGWSGTVGARLTF